MQAHFLFISSMVWWLIWIFMGNILFEKDWILFFLFWILFLGIFLLIFLKKHHICLILWIIFLFFGTAYSTYHQISILQQTQNISHFFWVQQSFVGQIYQIDKKTDQYHAYIVDISEISWQKIQNMRILIRVPPYFSFGYKQKISWKWVLDKVDNFSSNFNYQKYLLVKNIYALSYYPDIQNHEDSDVKSFGKKIYEVREYFLEKIMSFFPEKEAVLLAGILIGARENIPSDMQADFNNSGLTHLMAVSGFNITILIFFVLFVGKYFPLYMRIFLVTVVIIFFTLIVWDAPPVLRASIMWLLSYYILSLGRQADAFVILLFTASVLVSFQPFYLNYDMSFQLSFLAVLWLLYFQEFWRKICFFLPKFFAIQESFVLTLSAMTTTLPIMIFNFWQVSLLAPIANMLVGGMIPFVMFFGCITLLLSEFWYIGAYYIWFLSYFSLWFVNTIAHIFWNIDFTLLEYDFWLHAPYLKILYFMILGFWIIYFRNKKTPE